MSDWKRLSAESLREGRSLKEASRAYRSANVHVYRNPMDPREQHRQARRKRLGELLSAGHSFHEAQRMIDRGFARYQHGQRTLERTIVHPFSRQRDNPTGPNWLLLGAVAAVGAWWFLRNQQSAAQAPVPGPSGSPGFGVQRVIGGFGL